MLPSKWLGPGGRIEQGEDLIESPQREFLEGSGVEILDPKIRGTFDYIDTKGDVGTLFIITATKYEDEICQDCDEGRLEWHDADKIHELEDDDYFYSGLGFYNGEEWFDYTDSDGYFRYCK